MKWLIPVIIGTGVVALYLWKPSFGFGGRMVLPGAGSYSAGLLQKMQQRRNALGASYRPRTRHLGKGGAALFTNRLFLEKSPYLLQHAHNPVNWYPWGEEAFEEAQSKNLPVLLSVGYSTCHWCHVMEEESFEDLEIAEYLNKHYVAVKVDREERPDIDAVYMSVVQLMTGRGGWPMTVWLTPDKKPFYGGTYFPPREGVRAARVGFLSLLKMLQKTYHEKSLDILQQGDHIQQMVQKMLAPGADHARAMPSKNLVNEIYQQVKDRQDTVYGGLRGAPKFPSSFPIRFLLRASLKLKDKAVLQAVHLALDGMQKGGIRDHIGGGFHRYSVDEKWLVPHFEKMLYDQALLALAYLEAYHLFGTQSYRETAEGILKYVQRDMQGKRGGFYSATDADSEVAYQSRAKVGEGSDPHPAGTHNLHAKKEEGYYFTWKPEEIDRALSDAGAKLVKWHYGVNNAGDIDGRNILHITEDLSKVAQGLGFSLTQAKSELHLSHQKLLSVRNVRPLPLRDEKVLTSWNGLMISAFVYGAFVLGGQGYLEQAARSAGFIWDNMYKDGGLKRSWKNGEAYIEAYLDDYAFFISALLDLFEVSGELKWLERAIELNRILEQNFEDKTQGGFFMTSHHAESLMAREKPMYDGAEPSGNAIQALNLLRLAHLTGDKQYRKKAERTLEVAGALFEGNPLSASDWMTVVDFYHSRVHEVVFVLPDKAKKEEDALWREFKKWYLPNRVLVMVQGSDVKRYQSVLPLLKGKKAIKGRSTVYICEEGSCQLPAMDVKTLKAQLKDIQSAGYL